MWRRTGLRGALRQREQAGYAEATVEKLTTQTRGRARRLCCCRAADTDLVGPEDLVGPSREIVWRVGNRVAAHRKRGSTSGDRRAQWSQCRKERERAGGCAPALHLPAGKADSINVNTKMTALLDLEVTRRTRCQNGAMQAKHADCRLQNLQQNFSSRRCWALFECMHSQ